MAKGQDISDRLLDIGARVIKMADSLPTSGSCKHIASQIVRSATAAGANYEEACASESRKDFVHKLSVSLKELRETRYWIRLIIKAELINAERLDALDTETNELCAIIVKSIDTAKKNSEGG